MPSCSGWAAPRSGPRSSGARSESRRPARVCGCRCSTRPHPDAVLAVQESLDLGKTIFIVSSKSGGTVETLSQYHHFKPLASPEQFVVVTDPGSPLEELARDGRSAPRVPQPTGHRRPLLGAVVLRAGAGRAGGRRHRGAAARQPGGRGRTAPTTTPASRTRGLWLGAAVGELARQGRDKLTFLSAGTSRASGCGSSS